MKHLYIIVVLVIFISGTQVFSQSGTPIIPTFIVNDDGITNRAHQIPSICVNDSGVFAVVWQDYRNSPARDYYAQWFSPSGTRRGINMKVNSSSGSAGQVKPQIAMNRKGETVIVWEDYRAGSGKSDIYLQRFNAFGIPSGTNVQVNEATGTGQRTNPSVAIDSAGNYIVVWTGTGTNSLDIWQQKYTSAGTKNGVNAKVNDDAGSAHQDNPSIAMNASGAYVIAWSDVRSGSHVDIYAQRYGGLPGGPTANFKVNDDVGSTHQRYADIAVNQSGTFSIVWEDERNGNKDVYLQRYSAMGTTNGGNVKVNNNTAATDESYPSIGSDSAGNSVIAWQDFRSGKKENVYAQRLTSNSTALGNNIQITKSDTSHQIRTDIKLWNNRIYTVWEETKVTVGTQDIRSNVYDWNNPPNSVSRIESSALTTMQLSDNYPNPFNPTTIIEFHIPQSGVVKLTVFDVVGREVSTLVNEQLNSGTYRKTFDAAGLATGVYYYRLNVGSYSEIKKMIMLK